MGREMLRQILARFVGGQLLSSVELRRVAANGVWVLVEKGVRLVTLLLSSILMARYLQPTQYGLFSYGTAYVSLFAAVASLGLREVVIRDWIMAQSLPVPTSSEPGALPAVIINTAIVLRALSGVMVAIAAVLTAWLLVRDPMARVLVGIISITTLGRLSEVFEYPFEAAIQTQHVNILKALVSLLSLGLTAAAVYLNASVYVFGAIVACGSLVQLAVLGGYFLRQKYPLRPLQLFSYTQAKRTLKDSWPLMFSALAVLVYMRSDQLMIKSMVGDYELGIYSAAANLVEAIYVFPVALLSSILPKLIAAKADSEERFYKSLQSLYDVMALVSYGMIGLSVLVSSTAIVVVYGSQYAESGSLFRLLALTILPVNLGVARSAFFTANNYPALKLQIVVSSCMINIGLNLVLIPHWGSSGAAAATLVSYYFSTFIACFLWRPLRKTGRMLMGSVLLLGLARKISTAD